MTIIAAATQRRPDLDTVLVGGLAEPGGRMEAGMQADRPGATMTAPSPSAGGGAALRVLLDELRGPGPDGRRALAASTATLAEVLGRRVEVIEIGQSAGARAAASPPRADAEAAAEPAAASLAIVAEAALLPRGFGDAHLDAIIGWLSISLDRLRVRDRLRELALAPWGDAAGDGALLRLAAARAAVQRLLAATPAMDALGAPDVVVVSGGAWAVAPAAGVALGGRRRASVAPGFGRWASTTRASSPRWGRSRTRRSAA